MKNCKNCMNSFGRDICVFCSINGNEIKHPILMGGNKCESYERRIKNKEKFNYPKKDTK